MHSPELSPADLLKSEASGLDVFELMDLCYSFRKKPERLALYLEVLRQKTGQAAQAACCIICFDLARMGAAKFEAEFLALLPVIAEMQEMPASIRSLLDESEYLSSLWAELSVALDKQDPRHPSTDDESIQLEVDAIEIDLFDDDELGALEFEAFEEAVEDDRTLRAEWERALTEFFDIERGLEAMVADGGHSVSLGGGFRADGRKDMQRIRVMRDTALSLKDFVRDARELLPIAELFEVSHTRAKNLFGRKNKAREALLAHALEHFAELKDAPRSGVTWLLPPTAPPRAWEKVAELLLDYIAFLNTIETEGLNDQNFANESSIRYLEAERPQPPPDVLNVHEGRRRR